MTDIPTLTFVQPTNEPSPLNVVLYGPAGSGKTLGALSAPGPALVVNADGPNALRTARSVYGDDRIREVTFRGRQTLRAVRDYLMRGGQGEQTVVIDPLGEIYSTLLEEIGGKKPQIQHYGTVNQEIRDFVKELRDSGLNLVVVCHEQIDDSEEGGATRRPLTGGRQLPEALMGMMDVVAYCGVVEQDNGPSKYMGQLVQSKGRRCKDRTGALGGLRELNLAEWIQAAHDVLRAKDADLPWSPQPTLEDAVASGDVDSEPVQEQAA